MNTLNDQLSMWKNKNQPVPVKKKKEKTSDKAQKAHSEKLSDRDIRELMGMNRPRYEKRGGAIRQR
ncbi:hypothetical protein AWM68_20290 [Fictibacillus phosphorivorans]|uniref:Phage protein n=1 Tax=Fictibacillus phosphorivorans TaxID=1221500 RepID=A0A165NMS4_9BACL|nr:hypothetical protein [Fictibacillus phosphorivorans]KZE66781.1 hypothetical protein AWM68_20290 [Fictibacillus phosphorivorans]